jgi:hypothetical protein
MPIGSPASLQCSGSDIAGWPVTLNSGVKGMKARDFSDRSRAIPVSLRNQPASSRPTTSRIAAWTPVDFKAPINAGGAAKVGVNSTS